MRALSALRAERATLFFKNLRIARRLRAVANNPEFRPRIDPDLHAWLKSLSERGGYSGEDVARRILEALRLACGDNVPDWPLDFSLSIALKRSGIGHFETTKQIAAESAMHYGGPRPGPQRQKESGAA